MLNYNLMREMVKAHLKKSRYLHTLGVIEVAEKLALVYNINVNDAKVAALLHDYCKYSSDKEILDTINDYYDINEVIINRPNLGHGFLASIIIKKEFEVSNNDIINAVANHTFGRKGMTKLEKLIYLADSIEPNRNYRGVESLRKLAFEDLDQAVLQACENTLLYEINKSSLIHPMTIEMRNELIFNINNSKEL